MVYIKRTVIGVISDTHGLLRKEVIDALMESQLIIHAGDIGRIDVLSGLKSISPVIAVRGNIDINDSVSRFSDTETINVENKNIFIIHDLSKISNDIEKSNIDIVIYGHSHKPLKTEKGGIIYFNPGSAGPRRFKLPVSVGLIEITEFGLEFKHVNIT